VSVTLQEVDPDDLSTLLWDYTDTAGTTNPGGVQSYFGLGGTFSLGAPSVSIDTSDRTGDGAQDVTFSYDDIVQSAFTVRLKATSYDNLRTGLGVLQRLLSADGVMRYIPTGSTQTFYIYRKPSNVPPMFSGQELELYRNGALLEGTIPISFNRERLLRGATLLASVNKARNPTLLLASDASTTMLNWAWDTTVNITTGGFGANVSWPNQSYRFTIATTGTRNFQQVTPTGTAASGDIWTFSFYAKASGGTLCKARAVIDYRTAALGAIGGGVFNGTLITLSSTEQRISVTTTAAPATTSVIIMSIQFANADGTTYTVDIRRAQLEKAGAVSAFRAGSGSVTNKVLGDSSGLAGKAIFLYNPGDANSLARLSLAPSNGATTIAYLLARKSEGLDVNLAEGINQMTSATGDFRTRTTIVDKATMYAGTAGDTASVADSASTGGNAAKTTFTNQSSLVRRWRWVVTPTDPEALQGTWHVYTAARGEVGSAYRVCMHWQAANRDPVTNVEDEITFDCTDISQSKYVPLYLGDVAFDANAGDVSLTIEGWAARDDANANSLWWDVVYLVPADEQRTLLAVPGFREGAQSSETWLGSELTGATGVATTQPAGCIIGGVSNPSGSTKAVLDTQYAGVATPPGTSTSGGLVWAAGRHTVTARVQLQENDGAATNVGKVRIRKAPGVGGTVAAFILGGHTYSVGDFVKPISGGSTGLIGRTYRCTTGGVAAAGEPTWGATDGGTTVSGAATFTETTVASVSLVTKASYTSTRFSKTVAYTADGVTAYEGVVVFTAATLSGRKITVLSVNHGTQRVIDDTYSAQMLGDIEQLGTYNGATSIDDLVKAGPFITLGPGLNVLWVDLWSLPPSGYDDIDPRNALAFHDPTQSTTVSVDVLPRYWS